MIPLQLRSGKVQAQPPPKKRQSNKNKNKNIETNENIIPNNPKNKLNMGKRITYNILSDLRMILA